MKADWSSACMESATAFAVALFSLSSLSGLTKIKAGDIKVWEKRANFCKRFAILIVREKLCRKVKISLPPEIQSHKDQKPNLADSRRDVQ